MARKMNKVCIVCGNKYTFCPNCGSYNDEPAWKNIFCNENCKDLYDICVDLRDGNITESEAANKVKNCNLNVLEDATSNVSKTVKALANTNKSENKEEVKEKKNFKKEN